MDDLREAQARAIKKFCILQAKPLPPRRTHIFLAVLALALAMLYGRLESTDVSDQVIAERHAAIKAEMDRCEKNTRLLAHVLNGGGLVVGESTSVSCKAKHKRGA